MRVLSHSATPAKMVAIMRPVGVEKSMASRRLRSWTPLACSSSMVLKMPCDRAAEPVERRDHDHDHVTLTCVVEQFP